VWKSGTVFLLLVCALAFCMPEQVSASEDDLNREFIERFFRLGAADADAGLRITENGAVPDPGIAPAAQTNKIERSGEGANDPSWVGKFLQIAIIVLLGLIVYLLSRKSRARSRY